MNINEIIQWDQTLHNWGRILGQVGYKAVDPRPDYGHANFGWNEVINRIEGRYFNDCAVGFNVDQDAFEVFTQDHVTSLSVSGKPYREVIRELEGGISSKTGLKLNLLDGLEFRFPHRFDTSGIMLPMVAESLQTWKYLRSSATRVLAQILGRFGQQSEIRIWPTNFDTGIYCQYDHGIEQFAGFAQADDEVIGVPYFYNSFYQHNQRVVPHGYDQLGHGYWETTRWAGAVLPSDQFAEAEPFIDVSFDFLVASTQQFLRSIRGA